MGRTRRWLGAGYRKGARVGRALKRAVPLSDVSLIQLLCNDVVVEPKHRAL